MDKIVLTYLDIKGFAEPIRLTLHIGKIPFEDRRVSYEEVARMRSDEELPFGQVPVIEINGGKNRSQSAALLRWAGKKAGLYPLADLDAQLAVDEAMEAVGDIHKCLIPAWYRHACGRSPVSGGFFAATQLSNEQYDGVLTALNSELLPVRFQQLEAMLVASGGPYLCGEVLTVADLNLYVLVTGLQDGSFCEGISGLVVSQCPALLKLAQLVASLPAVVEWESKHTNRYSGQRLLREVTIQRTARTSRVFYLFKQNELGCENDQI